MINTADADAASRRAAGKGNRNMDLQLTGKVAVITGSGRGIGYASALALAREGARIVITDIDPDSVRQAVAGLKEAGFEAIGTVLDVCDDGRCGPWPTRQRAYGGIDILVNNAGFTRDKYLLKMPEADWDAVVDTILKGAYHCTRAALPSMMERKWGRVINIASRAHWGNPGQTNYSAAKAGLIGFTRALALEQGKFNITANAIAPGLIETPLVRGLSTTTCCAPTRWRASRSSAWARSRTSPTRSPSGLGARLVHHRRTAARDRRPLCLVTPSFPPSPPEPLMPEAHACGPLDVGHVFESAGRTITESDIVGFACLSGDFNRLHVDHEYAKGTPFGQRIAHGLLVLSVLSGLTSPAATAAWSPMCWR